MTCNPGDDFLAGGRAEEALRITGLEEVRIRQAPPAAEAALRLSRILGNLATETTVRITTYNIDFDKAFLEADPWRLPGPWGGCIMRNAHKTLNPQGKWPRLTEACEMLGIAYPGRAHDARYDAHAALLVHEAIEERRSLNVPIRASESERPTVGERRP